MTSDIVGTLQRLAAGMVVPLGGDRAAVVDADLAERFRPGDHLLLLREHGELLLVPAVLKGEIDRMVERAHGAFRELGRQTDGAILTFFDAFAANLEEQTAWDAITAANREDCERARNARRSTTRLVATERARRDMIEGLRVWRDRAPMRGRTLERVAHAGLTIEQQGAPLGVVGFVFEGRPNVLADAVGVLRDGNTAVLRIGGDALGTARALMRQALQPALERAGLPAGSVVMIDRAEREAAWALFSNPNLSLAVARGSGAAVARLGSIARQAGIPASLHGTGGAWMVADMSADVQRFRSAVRNSLDRKVCNTLNVCCIPEARIDDLVPAFLDVLEDLGRELGHGCKLHVVDGDPRVVPSQWLDAEIDIRRSDGDRREARVGVVAEAELGREWEWDATPEVTLKIVDDLEHAIRLFNSYSPRFVASLISRDPDAHRRFHDSVEAPFVGDGFTRWVDGQYALGRPELGLSNWETGRMLARSAILSGDSIYTVRSRAIQTDLDLHR